MGVEISSTGGGTGEELSPSGIIEVEVAGGIGVDSGSGVGSGVGSGSTGGVTWLGDVSGSIGVTGGAEELGGG